jgi:hypothetical protein
MPKKFSALNNSTIHTIALRTQHSAPDLRFTLHALRITLYAQLKTLNPQRTTQFYALRITLYAFNPQLTTRNPQPISGLTPLLPINFTLYASRITLYASRFTHHESRPFSKIANFTVKSVKSRIINHAPDGYQMSPEVVII